MGQFNPARFYSWTAGAVVTKFLAVHDGDIHTTLFPRDPVPAGLASESHAAGLNPVIYTLDPPSGALPHVRNIVNLPRFRSLHCALGPGSPMPGELGKSRRSFCFILQGELERGVETAGAGMGYYWPGPVSGRAGPKGVGLLLFDTGLHQP